MLIRGYGVLELTDLDLVHHGGGGDGYVVIVGRGHALHWLEPVGTILTQRLSSKRNGLYDAGT